MFQASVFSRGYNGEHKVFLQLSFASNMCERFLRLPFNLVTRDYMLLIMVYTVYHDAFVSGAVVFELTGQIFEFNV